jgi:hypothetical protein
VCWAERVAAAGRLSAARLVGGMGCTSLEFNFSRRLFDLLIAFFPCLLFPSFARYLV